MEPKVRQEKSCGVLAFRRVGNQSEYLVIRAIGGDIGFPKGHMEAGETEAETAARELTEETGVSARLIPGFRREMSYTFHSGNRIIRKKVAFFLGECTNDSIVPQKTEVIDAMFLGFEEAMRALTFDSTRTILSDADAFLRESRSAEAQKCTESR